jgi:DNA-binding NarL/FixJ family response regulator
MALKSLLQALGADVDGPAATTAEAERLVSEHAPDVALVDFNLREGERAYGLIDRLLDQGIRVVMTRHPGRPRRSCRNPSARPSFSRPCARR